jgi:hypothetical protein
MDIIRPFASIRVFQQKTASMVPYLLGVQERLASLEHLTINTSIPTLCSRTQCESHRLVMQPGTSIHMLMMLLKQTAVISVVNIAVL